MDIHHSLAKSASGSGSLNSGIPFNLSETVDEDSFSSAFQEALGKTPSETSLESTSLSSSSTEMNSLTRWFTGMEMRSAAALRQLSPNPIQSSLEPPELQSYLDPLYHVLN